MRTIVATALCLLFALPAAASERDARKANPDVAESLDTLLAEVADWGAVAEGCHDEPCDAMKSEVDAISGGLQGLWAVISSPDGKREVVDAAYREILDHTDAFERWMPQAEIDDLDGLCRKWTRTREKIDRFKRTMRQLAA